jgi:hypothetical protein
MKFQTAFARSSVPKAVIVTPGKLLSPMVEGVTEVISTLTVPVGVDTTVLVEEVNKMLAAGEP